MRKYDGAAPCIGVEVTRVRRIFRNCKKVRFFFEKTTFFEHVIKD